MVLGRDGGVQACDAGQQGRRRGVESINPRLVVRGLRQHLRVHRRQLLLDLDPGLLFLLQRRGLVRQGDLGSLQVEDGGMSAAADGLVGHHPVDHLAEAGGAEEDLRHAGVGAGLVELAGEVCQ